MSEKVELRDGRLKLYMRPRSRLWQCSAFLDGKNHRMSTGEENILLARATAEDWYDKLLGKQSLGELDPRGKFPEAATAFLKEYKIATGGERSERASVNHETRIRLHLTPFFGKKKLVEITPGLIQEYRNSRLSSSPAPSASTLHHELVTLRMIFKTAVRDGLVSHIPDMSVAYRTSKKVTHRAWFSPEEYKKLYTATRNNAKAARARHEASVAKRRGKALAKVHAAETLHDKVLFLANTGLRPDEAYQLEFRNVSIETVPETDETILAIEDHGKRGVGYCKSMVGAVRPFQRLKERADPKPTDKFFVHDHKT